jgi:membrane-associated phospholipid phosphatase
VSYAGDVLAGSIVTVTAMRLPAGAGRPRQAASPPGRAGAGSEAADAAFVPLTRVADRSVLWVMVAGVLAVAGGHRGRRAAVRGLGAIALASTVTNGPLKLAFRRPRPAPDQARVRRPSSSSFPSGHSASALAFAAAATAELPAAAPLLVPLAVAVAFSRVRTGVHRRADVLAGCAVGTVSGLLLSKAGRWHRHTP